MSVLIVGGDRLGAIPRRLVSMGFDFVHHYRGRFQNKGRVPTIPKECGLVIVLTDYVGHREAAFIREQAKARQVQVVYARRAWPHIQQQLSHI